ncbi:hypothetical protein H6G81_17675 [Scytonema hofmannii FACHB-248]|uniref:Uncharacterized protein n=1 Tax=Scytonema hofmannii FACHB-248 TaxID=1842502 RepID=A0ABR8GTB3_9CYAN|nr:MULTISPECIES: hypothetical protein [Nostocales]MBD2606309.1 hypothetical protein [Scytonema hofmannii FACHB-248]
MKNPQPTDGSNQQKRPFYATATAEEWITAFQEWAASHCHDTPPLSDYAVSRESMYSDERMQHSSNSLET